MDDSETGRQAAAGLAALRAELSAIRALLAERDAQLADLAGRLAERDAQLADRDAQLAEQDRRLAGQAERVRELEDEIRRLKKLPRRPDLKPNSPGASDGDGDGPPPGSSGSGRSEKEKRKRGRGPRRRNPNLRRREETVSLGNVPEGAVHKGYQDHTVRDIVSCAEEVVYRREVWEFPDGSRHVAPLPPGAAAGREQYGPCVKALAIMLHHQCQSTAGRIAGMPAAIGLDVSERQVGRFPTADAGGIAGEQEEVLRAGLETAAWISAGDTGARHKAGNGYCTAIGNDFFVHFRSTGSKSRLDFLEHLCAGEEDCTLNSAALDYMRKRNLSGKHPCFGSRPDSAFFGGFRGSLSGFSTPCPQSCPQSCPHPGDRPGRREPAGRRDATGPLIRSGPGGPPRDAARAGVSRRPRPSGPPARAGRAAGRSRPRPSSASPRSRRPCGAFRAPRAGRGVPPSRD